jgi:hypothetical protein
MRLLINGFRRGEEERIMGRSIAMPRKGGLPRGLVIVAVLAYCAVCWVALFHLGGAAVDYALGRGEPVTAGTEQTDTRAP